MGEKILAYAHKLKRDGSSKGSAGDGTRAQQLSSYADFHGETTLESEMLGEAGEGSVTLTQQQQQQQQQQQGAWDEVRREAKC